MVTPLMTQANLKRFPTTIAFLFAACCSMAILTLGVGTFRTPVSAADGSDASSLFSDGLSLGRYGQTDFGSTSEQPAKVEAAYYSVDGQPDMVLIAVAVELESPWHIYSLTQPKGGPLPTKIKLVDADGLKLVGDWQSDTPPKKSISQEFSGVTIEEHDDQVTFFAFARIEQPGQTAQSLSKLKLEMSGLTCVSGGACQPLDETLTAELAGPAPATLAAFAPLTAGTKDAVSTSEPNVSQIPLFQEADYAIQWQAYVSASSLHPGEQAALIFTALPVGEYHIYPGVAGDAPMSTNFAIEEKAGLRIATPQTDAKTVREEPVPGIVSVFHPGEVKWTLPIEVPADAEPGQRTISGAIAYQACTSQNCLLPMALRFEAKVNVLPVDAPEGDGSQQLTAIKLVTVTSKDAKTLAKDTSWVDEITPVVETPALLAPESPAPVEPTINDDKIEAPALAAALNNSSVDEADEPETAIGLPLILTFAFIGGFILNFMPCVLPVVGLKVMSFVQQAGADRRRAFMLNAAYSAGIMAIFAGLAVLMIFFSMAWGEMFTYMSVRIGLIVLLFAMALSYFGFWELPAPGMASSKGAQDLQKREGYTGAFFKGMFATILSTPCSGPLLGGIFPLIGGKLSPIESTIVILVVGLGMAVPYIMMGIWPKLTSWLPKPGPWMETFKEFLAFLFLATVAFFFYTFRDEDKLWVFVCLMGVWFGCWIIGKTPAWQTLQRRMIAWVSGVTAAVAISVLAFQFLGPVPPGQQVDTAEEALIAWEDYNEDRLQALQAEGKTVLVDFSAKWCLSCLVNLSVAIDTKPTAELVAELDAVAMYADWTDHSPEIKAKLDELESKSIPLLAIYPGSNPKKPILLRDLVTQQDVLKALREAGPSQGAAVATRNLASPRTVANR